MRRLLAIALLAILGLPLVAPLVASAALAETNLPACCRRNGAHHCGMNLRADTRLSDHSPSWRAPLERCPYYPAQSVVSPFNFPGMTTSSALFAGLFNHPAIHAQTESKWRIARDRARQKRGPPSFLFS